MNSETRMTIEEMAKTAGAIVSCPTCFGYDVRAANDDADRMAYAQATNAWKVAITTSRACPGKR